MVNDFTYHACALLQTPAPAELLGFGVEELRTIKIFQVRAAAAQLAVYCRLRCAMSFLDHQKAFRSVVLIQSSH